MAQILSGKDVSEEIRAQLRTTVAKLATPPKLAIIQVGNRADSNVYIRMKKLFAESVGAESVHIQFPDTFTEAALALEILRMNKDSRVSGIIAQLPFDSKTNIDSNYIINLIDPKKDVDCLTTINAGNMLHGRINEPFSFLPCTPNGCLKLIEKSGVKIAGSNAVVIGRSKIVGSPMAQLLIWNDATVTVCHSKTRNLAEVARQADILVVAIGRAGFVKRDWVKPGAVVIDCGINSIDDSSRKAGYRLVGDVDYDAVKEVASFITPVPGGVGPMTVAMLINNTVKAAERAQQ